jgi:hypothetical protein
LAIKNSNGMARFGDAGMAAFGATLPKYDGAEVK